MIFCLAFITWMQDKSYKMIANELIRKRDEVKIYWNSGKKLKLQSRRIHYHVNSGTASNHSVQNLFNFTTPVQAEWDFTKTKSSLWSREVTNIFKILVGKRHVKKPQGGPWSHRKAAENQWPKHTYFVFRRSRVQISARRPLSWLGFFVVSPSLSIQIRG
jgi:hypothetical protein